MKLADRNRRPGKASARLLSSYTIAYCGLDGDFYRSASSLRSKLALIRTLLGLSKKCLCPKLKRYALALHARKVKLKELKIRSE
jgi:hypothetical protein